MRYGKETIGWMIVILLLLGGVSACGGASSGNIALVKGGLLEADQRLTVGEAFDNYGFFKSCKWEDGKTDNGIAFVNAIGDVDFTDYMKGEILNRKGGVQKLETVFQFMINRDGNTFEYAGFEVMVGLGDGSQMTVKDWNQWLADNEKDYYDRLSGGLPWYPNSASKALQCVYDNQPLFTKKD